MAISHSYWHLVVKNANFTFLLTSTGQQWQFHIATDIYWSRMLIWHCYSHLMVKNGNFTFPLTSTGQEWQFHIPTDIYWSRMAISHSYWHLLVKNGNWQIYSKICQEIYLPNASWDIYYGMYLVAILYAARKGGNFLLFLIRVVNNQLAWYSHVRCNPLDTPKIPPTWQL